MILPPIDYIMRYTMRKLASYDILFKNRIFGAGILFYNILAE